MLELWRNGEAEAMNRLMSVLYPQLREIAGWLMSGEVYRCTDSTTPAGD
jgi:hypothetical protein